MYSVYMLRMQVYIPEDLFTDLKNKAAGEDTSMSEIVRKGLKKVLNIDDKRADPMRSFVGKCRIKAKTNAVEEINSHYKRQFK